MSEQPYLVIGGTGVQGGATVLALLGASKRVRVMARDPQGRAARSLASAGAEVVRGDLDDPASLDAAMAGVRGLFSVLKPDAAGGDLERSQGVALVEAAARAGVRQIVHSSVCQGGTHESFPKWNEAYWSVSYWTHKWEVEQAVRAAGFEHWTILRPSFIMTNLTHGRAQVLFPQLREGRLVSPVLPGVPVQMIAPEDIGAFALAAFQAPRRFAAETIELAGEQLTMAEIAAILGEVLDKRVGAQSLSPEEAVASGIPASWVRSQEWTNEVGYRVDRSRLPAYGVPLTGFREWVKHHREEFDVG
jgi:uncharacterized protein YbjT (DUF2867 family)